MSMPSLAQTLIALVLGLTSSLRAAESNPSAIRVRLPEGPYFVGQSIPLTLDARSLGQDAIWSTPSVTGGALSFVKRDGGTFQYRLVPSRAGRLVVGPFRIQDGDRSISTRPVTISVANPTVAGRPSVFLGGVGPFEVEAEAMPAVLRRGQTFTYSVRVTGLAAPGMILAPELDRVEQSALAPRVTRLPNESGTDPPSRTFRYEVRPTRAGSVVLPPVAVASFNPQRGRYVTKVTAGIPVRVVDVPAFDPGTLRLSDPLEPSGSESVAGSPWTSLAILGGILFAICGVCLGVPRGFRISPEQRAARRLLAEASRSLDSALEVHELGRRINGTVAEFLALTIGRPTGILTPEEARRGVEQATGSAMLGSKAGRLVALCDQARFGAVPVSADELRINARGAFEEMRREVERRDQERQ